MRIGCGSAAAALALVALSAFRETVARRQVR